MPPKILLFPEQVYENIYKKNKKSCLAENAFAPQNLNPGYGLG